MLKPNHLQSLIATTRTRINDIHTKVEDISDLLPILKALNGFNNGVLDERLEEGYKFRAALRRDIAKAVELQKALKLELKEAYKAAKADEKRVKMIDIDGQPTKDGEYYVLYEWHDDNFRGEKRFYLNGKWYIHSEGEDFTTLDFTAFGNCATAGERYIAV